MQTMNRCAAAAALVALLSVSACGAHKPEDAEGASGDLANLVLGARVPHPSAGTGYQPVKITNSFSQSIQYGHRRDYADPTSINVRNVSYGPAGATSSVAEWSYSTAFEIRRVAANQADRFYLLGRAPNGDEVIQFWKPKKYYPIGTTEPPQYKRTELFRGTALAPIHTIGIDYEQRYLLIVHGDPPQVSQMSLPSGSPIITAFDSTTNPGLDALRLMSLTYTRQHLTEGRLWILESWGHQDPTYSYTPRAVIYDGDNDGTLDSWLCPLTQADWQSLGYEGDVWDGDFVNQIE